MLNTHTRIYQETLKSLRMIYALTGESMIAILDRLVKEELTKIREAQNEQWNIRDTK